MLVMVNRWAATVPPGMVPKSWTNTAGVLSFWNSRFAHGTGAGCCARAAAGTTARANVRVSRAVDDIPRPPRRQGVSPYTIGPDPAWSEAGNLGEYGNVRRVARPPGGVCAESPP